MNKPQRPARRNATPPVPRPTGSVPNPLRQATSRWQRTARYGWDKGGANGGRK